jgi:DNA-binding transcriptional MerR regulator
MAEPQEVRTSQAARVAGMPFSTFMHYVRKGRCPPFEERAGVRFFKVADLKKWRPIRLKRGPKPKARNA